MDKFDPATLALWTTYHILRRGGASIMDMPPSMLDVVEAEIHGEGARAKVAREAQETKDFLTSVGVL